MIITDVQILAFIICSVLSVVAYRFRMPSIAIVPSIGFFVLGFQIYDASDDLLLLALCYFLAIIQFVLAFGRSR